MDTSKFLPAYPITLEENFHPAFTDDSLSSLLWICRYYNSGISKFLNNTRGNKNEDLLTVMGIDPEKWLKGEKQTESAFLESIESFCNSEIKSGRPHLAFLAGLTLWDGLWDGFDEDRLKLAVRLLKKVPDDICHPILKIAASEYVKRNYK